MNGKSRAVGIGTIVAAGAVFVVASIVQAIGGSSMFSTTYAEPDSFVLDLIMNLTFWPGWILTAALLVGGTRTLIAKE